MKSPFKFLDSFQAKDKGFFGREDEVNMLYDFVTKNQVVLVYGESGTGKTSIIQCGLEKKFDVTDWKPIFIRRGENLNHSLEGALDEHIKLAVPGAEHTLLVPEPSIINALTTTLFTDPVPLRAPATGTGFTEEEKRVAVRLVYKLQKLTEYYLRPIYLVFDQFEELLILADTQEKERFIKLLKVFLGALPYVDCHILLVMREEYFAWLDRFEKDIPGIVDRRLRIEAMRPKKVAEVIAKSCKLFNINLSNDISESPEKEQLERKNIVHMVNALTVRGEVSLPYLQVYLDQLWRIDFERTYPNGISDEVAYPPLTFTTEEILSFGEIKDVLQRFLIEQRQHFKESAEKDEITLPENFLNNILDCFVNELGTKNPIAYQRENGFLKFKKSPSFLEETDPTLVKYAIDFLIRSQILRDNGNLIEFGHDSLAKLVEKQRDTRQLRLNNIRVMIELYSKTPNELIPAEMIRRWERYIPEIKLKPRQQELFNRSKAHAEQEQLDQLYQKAKYARRKKRTRILYICFILGILSLGIIYHVLIKLADSYYAETMVMKAPDSLNSRDAVLFMKYIYDNTGDTLIRQHHIARRILAELSDPLIEQTRAEVMLTLNNDANLNPQLDVDISDNGKFAAVREVSRDSTGSGTCHILSTDTKKVIRSFTNVSYCYFLPHTQKLLIAPVNNSGRVALINNPDMFFLYDCRTGKTNTVVLNKQRYNHVLYSRVLFLEKKLAGNDNFRVGQMPSGKLVIPFMAILAEGPNKSTESYYRIQVRRGEERLWLANCESPVSSTLSGDKIIYTWKKNKMIDVYSDGNGVLQLPMPVTYTGFAFNGDAIAVNKKNVWIFDDHGIIRKRFTSARILTAAYARGNDDYIIGVNENRDLRIINTRNSTETFLENETLINCDLEHRVIVTQSLKKTGYPDTIRVKDYTGRLLSSVVFKNGIQQTAYNSVSRSLLVLTPSNLNKSLNSLYLLDATLKNNGSFYLTANDVFMFSRNGKSFLLARDNQIFVFKNKSYTDLTDFSSVDKWLTRDVKSTESKDKLHQIRKRYRDFPSKWFNLF